MFVEQNGISLEEDTFAYAGRLEDLENAKTFVASMKSYITAIKQIIETDFNTLSGKDLYELLKKFYNISLTDDDYLEMLSRKYNRAYEDIASINTRMTIKNLKQEGEGKDFSYCDQEYQICYKVAVADGVALSSSKNYPKRKIRVMLSNHDIVILNYSTEEITSKPGFRKEEYEEFPLIGVEFSYFSDNVTPFVLENDEIFGALLREMFPKKRVLGDISGFMSLIDYDISSIFSYQKSSDSYVKNIAALCKELFASSGLKEEYRGIQKELKLQGM